VVTRIEQLRYHRAMDEGPHARRRFAFVAIPLLTFAFATGLRAQRPERWIEELGDPEHSEAAECALVALGNAAVKPLTKLLEEWDTSTPRDKDRLRGALRVVDLLGMTAGPFAEILMPRGKSSQPGLHLELLTALGSLAPYASLGEWHMLYHHAMVASKGEDKRDVFVAMMRLSARTQVSIADTAGALQKIADDEVFVRECAAEFLGRSLDSSAIEPLRDRLRDRSKAPKGSDQLQHNGFTVPFDDQFRLRAGMALMQLGPQDGRCAIGFGCVALLHPHRSVRLTALRSMASLGTECAEAVPELLAIAEGPDAELAAEALKNLGMAGEAVNGSLARIQALETHANTQVQKRATSLARRLLAMGATVAPAAPPDPEMAELTALVAGLSDTSEDFAAASARLLAQPDRSWHLLFDRYRREDRKSPTRVVDLLVELAMDRPDEDRDRLRYIVCGEGDSWTSAFMSTFSGGGAPNEDMFRLYAKLVVGKVGPLNELAGFLEHENAAVRLFAANELRRRSTEVAQAENSGARDRLRTAVDTPHPEKSTFQLGPNRQSTRDMPLTTEIQAAAAAALFDCQIAEDQRNALILKLIPFEDAAVVVKGIERWGTAETAEALQKAAKDARPIVKAAAEKALERLREGK
jgi:hypothetical protein